MSKLFVVALSYALVIGVETTPYEAPFYYFLLSVTSFIIILLCFHYNDKLLLGYAALQFFCLILYLFNIFPENKWSESVLYDIEINYTIIMYVYEIILIGFGVYHVIHIHSSRLFNDYHSDDNDTNDTFQAKEAS